MANHVGGAMLNEVLELLHRAGVFERLGKAQSQQLVKEIVELACDDYCCYPGEILEQTGTVLGICSNCLSSNDDLKDGWCPTCWG